ncbi:MAG TPA: MFS transporter [Spirochaetia bacterium]|nr:MFS transporter [Spirochaetia bacterium]
MRRHGVEIPATLSWGRAVGMFSRNARLYLATAALMGLTIFGGIYALLFNLYLVRLGYGLSFIGSINATALLGWAAACLLAGSVGRRWGSRGSMTSGLLISMVGYLAVPFCELMRAGIARSVWLIVSYLVANVAISLYDVNSQPFLVESSTREERSHLFSLQAALWPISAFVGSLLGGFLPGLLSGTSASTAPGPYRFSLMASAATLIVAVVVLSRARPVTAETAAPAPTRAETSGSAMLLVLVGVLLLLHGFGDGTAKTFFNVYLDTELHTSTARIGLLAAVAQLVSVPAALLMPTTVRIWGHRRVFQWGTVGIVAGLIPLALVPHWTAAGAGYIVVVCLIALTRAALMVYLMEVVPERQRAPMTGVYIMAIGLSWSVAAAGGSQLIAALGYPMFYLAGAALTAASLAVFARITPGRAEARRPGAPQPSPRPEGV